MNLKSGLDQNAARAKEKGRYSFYALYSLDEAGMALRIAKQRLVGPRIPNPEAQFVDSSYENPHSQRKPGCERMVFFIGVDVDAKSTDPQHFDAEGRVNHQRLLSVLQSEHPVILRHVSAVARSRGGKGLHVIFRVSPFPLVNSCESESRYLGVNLLARSVQRGLVELFQHYGFGADPCAIGPRLWVNWIDGPCLYRTDEGVECQLKEERVSVLTEIRDALKEMEPVYRSRRVYNDERVEPGLGRLLLFLFGLQEERCVYPPPRTLDGVLGAQILARSELSMDDLVKLTGCSKPFLSRLLQGKSAHSAPWLCGSYDAQTRKWIVELVADDLSLLSARVKRARVLERKVRVCRRLTRSSVDPGSLPPPHEVQDGGRNDWLWRYCALQKLRGWSRVEVGESLERLVEFIPEFQTSRSVKNRDHVLASVFSNHPETVGIWSRRCPALPSWLEDIEAYTSARRAASANQQRPTSQTLERRSNYQQEALAGQGRVGEAVELVPLDELEGVLVSSRSGAYPFRVLTGDGQFMNIRLSGGFDLAAGDCVRLRGKMEWRTVRGADGFMYSNPYFGVAAVERSGFSLLRALESVAGVGIRLAERIVSFFGELSLQAILEGTVGEVPGVGPKTTLRLQERFLECSSDVSPAARNLHPLYSERQRFLKDCTQRSA